MIYIKQLKPQKSFRSLSSCNTSTLNSHADCSGNYRELMQMFKSRLHYIIVLKLALKAPVHPYKRPRNRHDLGHRCCVGFLHESCIQSCDQLKCAVITIQFNIQFTVVTIFYQEVRVNKNFYIQCISYFSHKLYMSPVLWYGDTVYGTSVLTRNNKLHISCYRLSIISLQCYHNITLVLDKK